MTNRLLPCLGNQSSSSSTCDLNDLACQTENYGFLEQNNPRTSENAASINMNEKERKKIVENNLTYNRSPMENTVQNVSADTRILNNERSMECMNSMLLNRVYGLLQEIIHNKQSCNAATNGTSHNTDEWNRLPDGSTRLVTTDDLKKNRFSKGYNKNNGTNKIMLCDCEKSYTGTPDTNTTAIHTSSSPYSSYCPCTNTKECNLQTSKSNENKQNKSSIFEKKNTLTYNYQNNQKYVKCNCQCLCHTKRDKPNHDKLFTENYLKSQNNMDCAVNNDTRHNSSIQNLVYCTLLSDQNYPDNIKVLPGPNIVVLSNGCNCCNNSNIPFNKVCVTTNTSEAMLSEQKKIETMETCNSNQNAEMPNLFTDTKLDSQKLADPEEHKSMATDTTFSMAASLNVPTTSKSSILKTMEDSTSADIPETKKKNKKGSKKQDSPKSKKKDKSNSKEPKEKSNKKKGLKKIDSKPKNVELEEKIESKYCSELHSLAEETCEKVLKLLKNLSNETEKFEPCNKDNCPEIQRFATELVENEKSFELLESMKNNSMQNENLKSCNCNEIYNFAAKITELCAKMNINNSIFDGKRNEIVHDYSMKNRATMPTTQINDDVKFKLDECEEIHRLASKIAELYTISNQNNLCESTNNSVSLDNADCDCCNLDNCPQLNPVTKNYLKDAEDCNCGMCPCRQNHMKYEDSFGKKERKSKINNSTTVNKKTRESGVVNFNTWTQEFPKEPQECYCADFKRNHQEIRSSNYNQSNVKQKADYCNMDTCPQSPRRANKNLNSNQSEAAKTSDDCNLDTCPQLRRIAKNYLCDPRNCYCQNPKLNDIQNTAKLERLAEDVAKALLPCNCMGQNDCNDATCGFKYNLDSKMGKYTTRQVSFACNCKNTQMELTSLNKVKDMKSAKNGEPTLKLLANNFSVGNNCLNGSKSETNNYIKKLLNTKQTKKKFCPCTKKLISSAKSLKQSIMVPILPIPDTVCMQLNGPNTYFPRIYEALSKIKELTKWDSIPQEIVELVIDKILRREIKCALHQMGEGVTKVISYDRGDNDKNNINILNLLLGNEMNLEEFKNNVLGKKKSSKKIESSDVINTKKSCGDTKNTKKCCADVKNTKDPCGDIENTKQFIGEENQDESKTNEQNKLQTIDASVKNLDQNEKSILVQINIEKNKESNNAHVHKLSSLRLKTDQLNIENQEKEIKKITTTISSTSMEQNVSSSSIIITKNKFDSINELIASINNSNRNWEENEAVSSSSLPLNDDNKTIAININIGMEKQTSKLIMKNTSTNTDKSKCVAVEIQTELQTVCSQFQEEEKTNLHSYKELSNIESSEPEIRTPSSINQKKKEQLISLQDFLNMNKYMKVKKINTNPK